MVGRVPLKSICPKTVLVLVVTSIFLCHTPNVFYTLLPFYATQIINPFHNSRISANHDKGEGFQPIVKSITMSNCTSSVESLLVRYILATIGLYSPGADFFFIT